MSIICRMAIAAYVAGASVMGAASPAAAQDALQAALQGKEEPDLVEPATLEEQVGFADVVVVARLVRRLEPRVQTSQVEARGKVVPSTYVFAQYLIEVERVLKAPAKGSYRGQQVIEQVVGAESLAAFRRGEPDLGGGELMLFLSHYPFGGTYQVGSWRTQFRRTGDGGAEPVKANPVALLVKKHRVLGAVAKDRASTGWVDLVQDVEAMVPRDRRGK